MKYDFKNPNAIYCSEIQDLIGRHRGIYEGYGFAMPPIQAEDYAKDKRYFYQTIFCLEQEYCIPESVGVMQTVGYTINDYSPYDLLGHSLRRPRIYMESYIKLRIDKRTHDDVCELAERIRPNHTKTTNRLLDRMTFVSLFKNDVREDMPDRDLSLRIEAMLDIVPRKMAKLGYERTA